MFNMTNQMLFRKAERRKAKLRLGLVGPAGSGKTWSALAIAKGIGGKVALIDTESGSGDLYANSFDYDILTLSAPFSPDRYIEAIMAAEKANYDIIIIDSLSHAWAGSGGVLEMQGKIAEREKNSYTSWRTITPKHNALVDSMLQSTSHIIATMRSKTDYELVEDERGRKVPRKIGLAPVQREGMDFEMSLVFDIDWNHEAKPSKDRTGLFPNDKFIKLSEETGKEILTWLETGLESTPDCFRCYSIKKIRVPSAGKQQIQGKEYDFCELCQTEYLNSQQKNQLMS